MSSRIRVGVIRGGPSSEHEVSLATGAAVLRALLEDLQDHYEAKDVLISRDGKWTVDGLDISPEHAVHHFDVAFNALHGAYGEDGKIQRLLDHVGVPYTGSGSLSSAVGMNKILAKQVMANHNIKSPYWNEIRSDHIRDNADAIAVQLFKSFAMPAVVKPVSGGSSVGVTMVRVFDDLASALRAAAEHGDSVMVEEYIQGVEATCGVIEGDRGHDLYALPPVEIRPKKDFFDYEAKYSGMSEEIVPSRFPDDIKKELEELATNVHRLLQLKHYSRSDFMVHPKRGIYFLEANTLPGLTNESLLPKALRAVGSSLTHFIDHIIRLAINK